MAQRLKDEIQERIAAAALAVFARKGFRGATMAEIGKAAGVSTGNIYRYYTNKDVLFYALITDELVAGLLDLMRRRVGALDGVRDLRALEPTATYHVISRELLALCMANRLQVVILLGKAQGTRYAGFADEVVATLVKLAIAHFRAIHPGLRVTRTMRFNLEAIYRNLVGVMVSILIHFDREADIEQAVMEYSRYHLFGLARFFG